MHWLKACCTHFMTGCLKLILPLAEVTGHELNTLQPHKPCKLLQRATALMGKQHFYLVTSPRLKALHAAAELTHQKVTKASTRTEQPA